MISSEKSMNSKPFPKLILASTSPYRRQLLETLGLPFDCIAPEFAEHIKDDESVDQATRRLAHGKAAAVAARHPQACVIGSDQLCVLPDGRLVGKPGSLSAAARQLAELSGQQVEFVSAVSVLFNQHVEHHIGRCQVRFRALDSAAIERYLQREPEAIHCAGSFMSESLGITLVESIRSDDPNILIGLPLIACASMLRDIGYLLP